MDRSKKFLFTGPPGVGKTTAISCISDIEPVSTDMSIVDRKEVGASGRATTTVALDFGEIRLDGGEVIRLYGTPGQRRFDYMWKLLTQGAMGVVILIDKSRPDPVSDLAMYLENFATLIERTAAVVGITRYDVCSEPEISSFYGCLQEHGMAWPVIECDIRVRDDVVLLMDALMGSIEFRNEGNLI